MKRFDDLLPEEREPQHEELITLLQRAYRRPAPVPPTEQEEVITQVRERLVKADHGDSFNGDRPIPQIGVLDSSPHTAVSRFPLMLQGLVTALRLHSSMLRHLRALL